MAKTEISKKEQEHFDKLVETTGYTWWGLKTRAGQRRFQRRAQLFKKDLAGFERPRVLEIGCGMGHFSEVILKEIDSIELVGCDISPRALEKAVERCKQFDNVEFHVVDVLAMPYKTDEFDAVVGNAILHHLPVEALQEIYRVLKPGGIIWFAEPNMLNPHVALVTNVPFIARLLQNTEDETAFIRWKFYKVLKSMGFENISIKPFDFLHPLTPDILIGVVERVGYILENVPLIREISGSLIIKASKPFGSKEKSEEGVA